ncbi:hypothetical protein WJX73_006307 [Symbiochloris irregularis]|uniref:Mitochondrial carrier protein n=1 Tax=Symbiochloris irregularis TaxID=706552 RepID=A0AAW1NWH0_9CHLO
MLKHKETDSWQPSYNFEMDDGAKKPVRRITWLGRRTRPAFASTSATLTEGVISSSAPAAPPPPPSKVDAKPATDVLAGAMARAASQGTIHPLDTLKVRMQHGKPLSKIGKLIPPSRPDAAAQALQTGISKVASLYKGVLGAASGAGIYIGTYFAVYGAATNLLAKHTKLGRGGLGFVAGAVAAAGGSVVKVPLAVCIRSVQAGVYPNAFNAASSIVAAAGPRGLFAGYLPTLLEDVPDMAFKFAAYETMRTLHSQLRPGRPASAQEDFAMGMVAGAFAAAATTPLDAIKTHMMCTAASRPSMRTSTVALYKHGGLSSLFRGVGPRALSNGINSAVFFCIFEALRGTFARKHALAQQSKAAQAADALPRKALVRTKAQHAPARISNAAFNGGEAKDRARVAKEGGFAVQTA